MPEPAAPAKSRFVHHTKAAVSAGVHTKASQGEYADRAKNAARACSLNQVSNTTLRPARVAKLSTTARAAQGRQSASSLACSAVSSGGVSGGVMFSVTTGFHVQTQSFRQNPSPIRSALTPRPPLCCGSFVWCSTPSNRTSSVSSLSRVGRGAVVGLEHRVAPCRHRGWGAGARAMDIHQSTASNLVRALVKKGLIRSARDDERPPGRAPACHGRKARPCWPMPHGPSRACCPMPCSAWMPTRLARLHTDLGQLIAQLGVEEVGTAAQTPLAEL